MLKTEVKDEAETASAYLDETLARRIVDKAAKWNVPLRREDIVIRRGFDDVTVEVNYSVEIDFPGGYKRIKHYSINVNTPLRETKLVPK